MENIYDIDREKEGSLGSIKSIKSDKSSLSNEGGIVGSIKSKLRPNKLDGMKMNEFRTLDRRKNKMSKNMENINDFNNMNLNSSELRIKERLFSENKNNSNLQINIENNSYNKCKLYILYYDENLKNKDENKDICTFFEMNLLGTFYGCHYFELFKNICEKIKRNKIKFILISSGSSAEKFLIIVLI